MTTDKSTVLSGDGDGGFWVRPASEWSLRARKSPVPRFLIGEFWLEGELAILFGDTGRGKSVLAVQIAESIARGRHIGPLRNEAGRRNVVYVDLEMNEKQFEMRYAEDHAGGKAKYLHGHYDFADGFDRVETDLTGAPEEIDAFARYFVTRLEKIVTERQAKVLIIDNITCLRRTYYGARETLPIIKLLKRLRDRLGLSILVVAHSHRRETPQRIGINDLQGSKLLDRYADSIFAIAENRLASGQRYFKQIRQRSGTIIYDASHVPVFKLKKIGGNFLGFEFETFAPEIELLRDIRDEAEWQTIKEIKNQSNAGRSIREIASLVDLPKTTVHRLLKMWKPPAAVSSPHYEEVATASADRVVPPFDLTKREDYFPGLEEYDEAGRDPRFDACYETEDHANYVLRREAWLIEMAEHRAGEIYQETGVAPKLHEDPDYAAFLEYIASGRDPFELDRLGSPDEEERVDENSSTDPDMSVQTPSLEQSVDDYGDEILVESREDNTRKHAIWYKRDRQGNVFRHVRKNGTIDLKKIEDKTWKTLKNEPQI